MRVILIFVLLTFNMVAHSQVSGIIKDKENKPIDAATVVMQSVDSTFIEAAISGQDGRFIFTHHPLRFKLIFQHILFDAKEIICDKQQIGTVILNPKENELGEVVVKADKPFVKIEDGKLGYDLSAIVQDKVVNNAYEALSKLPGVKENNGSFSLAGASTLTVILNGKPTLMDASDFQNILKNTPVDRVEKVEVMYSAPPKYHVRGAVINVVLKREKEYSFNGELIGRYSDCFFGSKYLNTNFRFTTPKLTFDIISGLSTSGRVEYVDLTSHHTYNNKLYEIDQEQYNRIKTNNYAVRAALDYYFSDKSKLSAQYWGGFVLKGHMNSKVDGNYQSSISDIYDKPRTQDFSMEYTYGDGFKISGEYAKYRSNLNQFVNIDYTSGKKSNIDIKSGQELHSYSINIDDSHKLGKGWNLGYGGSYKNVHNESYQVYNKNTGVNKYDDVNTDLREQTSNFYLSFGKDCKKGVSFSVSASGEYYSLGEYNNWSIYPQANLSYTLTPKNIFQLSLSTNKTFPSYWNMQTSSSPFDGYSEMCRTADMRPMTTYNFTATYIFNQRYNLSLYYENIDKYFSQQAYQAQDRLAFLYQFLNWKYSRKFGATLEIPVNVTNWYSTTLSLDVYEQRERCDDFFDMSFDRKKTTASGSLDNVFKLSNNLSFELEGVYDTPSIFGIYNMTKTYAMNASAKWEFAKGKADLSLRCDDIFETNVPFIKVDKNEQRYEMNMAKYSRYVLANFTYRFGGYKNRRFRAVDTSRFGH